VRGRVCPLLQLGAGFHPDLTGAENVAMNAALLGVGRQRLAEIHPAIVDFSGVAEFIDEPLRTYSAGMVLRLAFAVAVHVEPEILLIDELLAVGDGAFQETCLARLLELRRSGRTLVCASHELSLLSRLCDRALWLDHGRVVRAGSVGEVLDAYRGRAAAG
jgi:homopolymeric O-antigen transport system ATP-binding protein